MELRPGEEERRLERGFWGVEMGVLEMMMALIQ
jgi:hypothetical protein